MADPTFVSVTQNADGSWKANFSDASSAPIALPDAVFSDQIVPAFIERPSDPIERDFSFLHLNDTYILPLHGRTTIAFKVLDPGVGGPSGSEFARIRPSLSFDNGQSFDDSTAQLLGTNVAGDAWTSGSYLVKHSLGATHVRLIASYVPATQPGPVAVHLLASPDKGIDTWTPTDRLAIGFLGTVNDTLIAHGENNDSALIEVKGVENNTAFSIAVSAVGPTGAQTFALGNITAAGLYRIIGAIGVSIQLVLSSITAGRVYASVKLIGGSTTLQYMRMSTMLA